MEKKLNRLCGRVQSFIVSGKFDEALEACKRGLSSAIESGDEEALLAFAESYVEAVDVRRRDGRPAGLGVCINCGREGTKRSLLALGAHIICFRCVRAAYELMTEELQKR